MNPSSKIISILSLFKRVGTIGNRLPWQWFLLIGMFIFLQGCFEVEVHFTFNEDETYDSKITFVADEIMAGEEVTLASWRTGFIFPEVAKNYQHSVEHFRKDYTKYIRHTYQGHKLSTLVFEKRDDFQFRKMDDGSYSFQATIPPLLEKVSEKSKTNPVVSILITFPKEVDIANSMFVQGKTVKWVLTKETFLNGVTLKAITKKEASAKLMKKSDSSFGDAFKKSLEEGASSETGKEGWLGFKFETVSPELLKTLPLPISPDTSGVMVTGLRVGGPADKAKIFKGDIIQSFNGATVKNEAHLRFIMKTISPGTQFPIGILRDGSFHEVTATMSDLSQAFTMHLQNCNAGYSLDCVATGIQYVRGQGIEKNTEQGISFVRQGCDGGAPEGCAFLGVVFFQATVLREI